jgi:hypothetical protein
VNERGGKKVQFDRVGDAMLNFEDGRKNQGPRNAGLFRN